MKFNIVLCILPLLLVVGCNTKSIAPMRSSSHKDSVKIITNNLIINKYWKLITLNGQKVTMVENQQREMYFTLKTEGNRVKGFSGCNQFSGTYTLLETGKIHFSQMFSTMMACPDVAVNESEFLKVFSITNSYKVVGDTLWLEQGGKKQMATFAAIYFQ